MCLLSPHPPGRSRSPVPPPWSAHFSNLSSFLLISLGLAAICQFGCPRGAVREESVGMVQGISNRNLELLAMALHSAEYGSRSVVIRRPVRFEVVGSQTKHNFCLYKNNGTCVKGGESSECNNPTHRLLAGREHGSLSNNNNKSIKR